MVSGLKHYGDENSDGEDLHLAKQPVGFVS